MDCRTRILPVHKIPTAESRWAVRTVSVVTRNYESIYTYMLFPRASVPVHGGMKNGWYLAIADLRSAICFCFHRRARGSALLCSPRPSCSPLPCPIQTQAFRAQYLDAADDTIRHSKLDAIAAQVVHRLHPVTADARLRRGCRRPSRDSCDD